LDQKFFDPIELPGRKPLVTLRDAAAYINEIAQGETRCPRMADSHRMPDVVGSHGGDTMLPHIAMMKALRRVVVVAAPAPRRKRAKGYKVVR
jgi:hypothetical protein